MTIPLIFETVLMPGIYFGLGIGLFVFILGFGIDICLRLFKF